MKKLIFALALLISGFAWSQDRPIRADVVFLDTLTTTERDALTMRPSQFALIANSTVDSVQAWIVDKWVNLGSTGSGETYTFGTGLTNTSGTITVTNPFEEADETKLDGIAAGATVGANWNTNLSNIPANLDLDATNDVTLTSNQTITGIKTFDAVAVYATQQFRVNGSVDGYASLSAGNLQITSTADTSTWTIGNREGTDISNRIGIRPKGSWDADVFEFDYGADDRWEIEGSPIITAANASGLGVTGSDDQTASEVPITASGFSGNLDTGITNVQLLAEAVDTLTISGGSAAYRNPEVLYVARTSGDVTNAWAETSGQEGKKVINYCATGNCYYNIPSGLTTLQSILLNPIVNPGANMIFTSDNFTIRGNGTQYVSIGPNPASGFVGVYVDSANVVNFSRNNILTAHTFWGGYFKPYSISQVTGLASSNIAETSFDIDWDAATASVGTISDYQYSIDGGTPVDVTGATGATVSGLTASTTYNVNVRAVDAGGNVGQYSADLSVTTTGGSAIAALDFEYDFNAESLSLGALSSWPNDGSGVCVEAVQGTATNQPTVVDQSGKKAVVFDGVNDILNLDSYTDLTALVPGTSNFTIIVVLGDDSRSTGTIIGDRDAIDRSVNVGMTSSTSMLVQIGSTGQDFDTVPGTGDVIYSLIVSGNSYDSYSVTTQLKDGATSAIGGADGNNSWHIGGRSSAVPTTFFNGSVKRILVKLSAITEAQLFDVISEIQTVNQ